jgi:hypothetical protein
MAFESSLGLTAESIRVANGLKSIQSRSNRQCNAAVEEGGERDAEMQQWQHSL